MTDSARTGSRVARSRDHVDDIGVITSVRELVAAACLALLGAAGCALGLVGVIDISGADTDVWHAILLVGAVIAAVSVALVVVATQRRHSELRKLEAMIADLLDDVRAPALTTGRARVLTARGRKLRLTALEAGAPRPASEVSHALAILVERRDYATDSTAVDDNDDSDLVVDEPDDEGDGPGAHT